MFCWLCQLGNFLSWDGTSTGANYKSISGKNWDFDPFKDIVETLPKDGKGASRAGNEKSYLAIYDIDSDGGEFLLLMMKQF